MLVIAFFVLLLAFAMKVVAKVSDSRSIFQLAVLGFIVIYVLAAVTISWLNPNLPRANIPAFVSNLMGESAAPANNGSQTPSEPGADIIINR